MKKCLLLILIAFLFCFANSNVVNGQNINDITMLYPTEAFAIKYGQSIRIPDLSGLPIFSATYNRISNTVIVRNGDRKLRLNQSNNKYYQSGQYGNLKYSMEASVFNGIVSKIIYLETEDNITVKITYMNKN